MVKTPSVWVKASARARLSESAKVDAQACLRKGSGSGGCKRRAFVRTRYRGKNGPPTAVRGRAVQTWQPAMTSSPLANLLTEEQPRDLLNPSHFLAGTSEPVSSGSVSLSSTNSGLALDAAAGTAGVHTLGVGTRSGCRSAGCSKLAKGSAISIGRCGDEDD